jgi:hypothetical protein
VADRRKTAKQDSKICVSLYYIYIIKMADGKCVPFMFSTSTLWQIALASMKQNGRTLFEHLSNVSEFLKDTRKGDCE